MTYEHDGRSLVAVFHGQLNNVIRYKNGSKKRGLEQSTEQK